MTVNKENGPSQSPQRIEPDDRVSQAFLQTVIDAVPDSLMVIDRDYSVVLANRTARSLFGLPDPGACQFKCYEVHRRESPCEGEDEPCPLREVMATKSPARVHHTHYSSDGKKVAVAIDAAPVFDAQGEVMQVIESCHDVTESVVARELLRIGNRHMQLGPMLQEAALTLRAFTGCTGVGIRIREKNGEEAVACSCDQATPDSSQCIMADDGSCDLRRCFDAMDKEAFSNLPATAEGVSVYKDCSEQLLAAISDDAGQDHLTGACHSCNCKSVALVPIIVDEDFLGLIHFACHRQDTDSLAMYESLGRLASELGTAIQCVRAEESLQAARDDLEVRVQQRTAELTEANRTLQEEINERTRLEREIHQVAAKEQQRIGQELHDGIGQELTGLSYLAQSLYQKLRNNESAESELAQELAQGIPQVLGQIRQVVKGLLPLEVGARDLDSALELLATNVTRQTGVSCRFEDGACAEICDDDVAIQVYRIAQEGIANAVKHADSQHIVVSLKPDGDHLRLEVRDDGNGIQFSSQKFSGRGLRTMQSRARAIGGSLEVAPAADGGTLVNCVLPRQEDDNSDLEAPGR